MAAELEQQTPPIVDALSRRERLERFPWWLVGIVAILALMALLIATNPTYRATFEYIQRGLGVTLYTTLASFVVALGIGLLAGLGRISRNVVLRNLATAYIEFVRGVPILVLIFTVAFVLVPLAAGLMGFQGNAIDFGTRAIIALAIIYGAYIGEVFRAGIESIPHGQMEAARSLGLTHTQAMIYVILPQAVRNVLPALGNDFIALLKDSSLVSVLAVRDITQQARLYVSVRFQYEAAYLVLTFLYLVMTLSLSLLLQWYQRRLRNDG